MPGPGGGSRGGSFGGGSRGGFGGGSRGSFGGSSRPSGGHRPGGMPPMGGPRPPMGGHFGRRPWGRPGYGPFSSCSGCAFVLVFIIIILITVVSSLGSAVFDLFSGGSSEFSEEKLQAYADSCYANEFGSNSVSYEDNILLVFLVNDECNDFRTIAWVGDNIRTEITNLFGNESTVYGNAVFENVDTDYYTYSLSKSLASVVNTMEKEVSVLGLDSSFVVEMPGKKVDSHFVNKSELKLNNATIETALDSFTEKTGIPIAVVVDTMEPSIEKSLSFQTVYTALGVIACVGVVIWLIARKAKKSSQTD